jgi:hypothetical protein
MRSAVAEIAVRPPAPGRHVALRLACGSPIIEARGLGRHARENGTMDGPIESNRNGRGDGGKFAPGHGFSKGPHKSRLAELREAVRDAATPEMLQAIVKQMTVKALKDQDVAAARLVLEFSVGRPSQQVEVSGPDGSPLGLDFGRLQSILMGALAEFPAARVAVALHLRRLADDGGRPE